MKRIITIALLIVSVHQSQGQEGESLYASVRNWTAELYIPTIATERVAIDQVRFRYFLGERTAFRLTTKYSSNSDEPNVGIKTSITNFELGIGLEKHFASFKSVSPFFALDYVSASKDATYDEGFQGIFGALDLAGDERGFTKSGGRFVVGFDYYPAKGFYVGTEFGMMMTTQRSREIKQGANKESALIIVEEGNPQRQFHIGSAGVIRLGFVF